MNSKGSTLLELVSLLGIISIMATFSVFHLKKDKLKGAAKMIYYDLHYARMTAIKGRNKCRITFDTTSDIHTYQIHNDLNSNGNKDDGESVITKNINKHFKGISFSSNQTTASYTSFGTSNSGTITIRNGPDTKKVIFSREGRVRIE